VAPRRRPPCNESADPEPVLLARDLSNQRSDARWLPAILAQASSLLVSLARNPIMSQTCRAKFKAYLAAGRPIIASLDGEGASIVSQTRAGIACPAEDAAALGEAGCKLRSLPMHELQRTGQSGGRYYERHFEPGALARRLSHRVAELVTTRSRSRRESYCRGDRR
jgi:glycosyltransferase involved in cell wall biosynthesis